MLKKNDKLKRLKLLKLKSLMLAGVFAASPVSISKGSTAKSAPKVMDAHSFAALKDRPRNDWQLGDLTAEFESKWDPAMVNSSATSYGMYQLTAENIRKYVNFVKSKPEYKEIYTKLKDGVSPKSWKEAAQSPLAAESQNEFMYTKYLPPRFAYLRDKIDRSDLPSEVKKIQFKDLHPAVLAMYMSTMNHHRGFSEIILKAMKKNGPKLNTAAYINSVYEVRNQYTKNKFKTRFDAEKDIVIRNFKRTEFSWQSCLEISNSIGLTETMVRDMTKQIFESGLSYSEINQKLETITGFNTYELNPSEILAASKKAEKPLAARTSPSANAANVSRTTSTAGALRKAKAPSAKKQNDGGQKSTSGKDNPPKLREYREVAVKKSATRDKYAGDKFGHQPIRDSGGR